MPNHLVQETSPYLLQHVDNPVEWYPWGEEALTLALEQDKPILLSIGYAACHWCHVMAHESFEDLQTAERSFQSSLEIAQENGDKFLEAYAWQGLGKVYGDQGRSQTSRDALTQALHQFEAMAIVQEIKATRRLLDDG